MKYVPGLMVGQLSGKAGSTVASRNKNGSYFRTRVIPKLVRNSATSAVRDIFTTTSQAFRGLSTFEQQSWISLGLNIKRSNSLGETFSLSGIQAYKALNGVNEFYGNPILATAPSFQAVPGADACHVAGAFNVAGTTTTIAVGSTGALQHVTTSVGVLIGDVFDDTTAVLTANVIGVPDATHVLLDASITTTTADAVTFTHPSQFTLTFDLTPIPAGLFLIVEMTRPLSASDFRFLTTEIAAATSPKDLTAAYVSRFGKAAPGTQVFYRLKYASTMGFLGGATQDRCFA